MTASEWALRVNRSLPLATSQNLTSWSNPPDARVLPPGTRPGSSTMSAWPASVARSFASPAATSQSLIAPSSDADASRVPSGEYTTARIAPLCPLSVTGSLRTANVPEPHRTVAASRGERLTVGGKRHGADRRTVAMQGGDFIAPDHVPKLDELVVSARGQRSCRRVRIATERTQFSCPLNVVRLTARGDVPAS